MIFLVLMPFPDHSLWIIAHSKFSVLFHRSVMHFDLSGHVASTLASSELSAHGGEAWQKGDGAEEKRGCPEVNFEN